MIWFSKFTDLIRDVSDIRRISALRKSGFVGSCLLPRLILAHLHVYCLIYPSIISHFPHQGCGSFPVYFLGPNWVVNPRGGSRPSLVPGSFAMKIERYTICQPNRITYAFGPWYDFLKRGYKKYCGFQQKFWLAALWNGLKELVYFYTVAIFKLILSWL